MLSPPPGVEHRPASKKHFPLHSLLRKVLVGAAFCLAVGGSAPTHAAASETAVALTPPMGWNSWNHFRLNINDALIRAQAQAMATNGMKAVGYEYIVIDGGWEGYHDTNGVFIPDTNKFPNMAALCDYVHSLGLKVGIHDSPGPTTCAGREASYGHEVQDARTFAGWGMDFLKHDWCSAGSVYQTWQMQAVYRAMAAELAATGRPFVYSLCQYGQQNVWQWGASVGGNMWRTSGDIANNYSSMTNRGFSENGLEGYAGPGHWNDPDMLEIGNGGMTQDEERTQMSLWCLLAAPLFAGNDLTQMTPETLALLTNPEVLAVDQDPAGIQGRRMWLARALQIWMKPLSDGSQAVGLFNCGAVTANLTLNFNLLGLAGQADVRDLWARADDGRFNQSFVTPVPPHGVVLLKVQSVPLPARCLVWRGTAAKPNWDVGVSTNWLNGASLVTFANGDNVTFDDTATHFSPNIAATVQPNSVLVNAAANYTFAGSGAISGATSLTKAGSGTLLLRNVNSFTGPITINAGILQLGTAGALGTGNFIYATNNQGTLDLNDQNAGLNTIVIAGAGYNGLGALYDSSTNSAVHYLVTNLTLAGDAAIGANGRWDCAGGTLIGNGFKLTKVGPGNILFEDSGDPGWGDIEVTAGRLGFQGSITLGEPANTLTVASNATVTLYSVANTVAGAHGADKHLVLNNGAALDSGGSSNNCYGTITLVGTNLIGTRSALALWANLLDTNGRGGFVLGNDAVGKSGADLWLNGANTHSGPTIISNRTLHVGAASSLGDSAFIEINSGATLDLSSMTNFNLGAGSGGGQMLMGTGTVIGPTNGGNLTFNRGATLAAGFPGMVTGALTNSGNLTLQEGSTNLVKVYKTTGIANDKVTGLNSVTMGGTLLISNLGSALVPGDAIQLFSATAYSGGFRGIIPASPGAGLAWDTSLLDTSGTLKVVTGINTTPTNLIVQATNNLLMLTWPADRIGWELQVQRNALTVGLSTNWVAVAGSTTTNQVVVPINPTNGCTFYRLRLCPPQ